MNILKIHNTLISLGLAQAIAGVIHSALISLEKNFQEVLACCMLKTFHAFIIGTQRKSLIEREVVEYSLNFLTQTVCFEEFLERS